MVSWPPTAPSRCRVYLWHLALLTDAFNIREIQRQGNRSCWGLITMSSSTFTRRYPWMDNTETQVMISKGEAVPWGQRATEWLEALGHRDEMLNFVKCLLERKQDWYNWHNSFSVRMVWFLWSILKEINHVYFLAKEKGWGLAFEIFTWPVKPGRLFSLPRNNPIRQPQRSYHPHELNPNPNPNWHIDMVSLKSLIY